MNIAIVTILLLLLLTTHNCSHYCYCTSGGSKMRLRASCPPRPARAHSHSPAPPPLAPFPQRPATLFRPTAAVGLSPSLALASRVDCRARSIALRWLRPASVPASLSFSSKRPGAPAWGGGLSWMPATGISKTSGARVEGERPSDCPDAEPSDRGSRGQEESSTNQVTTG